jgi:histidine triad (HIT) family protein
MTYDGTDIYCDLIISKKLKVNIEYEDEDIIAFHHTKPFWQTHIVITPKKHIDSLLTVEPRVLNDLHNVIKKISEKVLNTENACGILTNLGDYQDSKHLHFHVYSGKRLHD